MDVDIVMAIESAAAGFSKGQKRIAEYIMANYEKAAFMTAGKLARLADVSESTVVRFAAELGYDGYPEMRTAIRDMIRNRLTSVQRIKVAKNTIDSRDILSHVLSSDIEQIRLTLEETNRQDFNKAAQLIAEASNVYILGLRASSFLADLMGYYFNLVLSNVRVVNESSAGEVFEKLTRLSSGDVLITVSFPRYSKRTIKAMQYARDVGASVLAITDNRLSPLVKHSDITLYARSDMVSFMDTLVAPLSLINALVVEVSERAPGDIYACFERLEQIWNEYDVYEKLDL